MSQRHDARSRCPSRIGRLQPSTPIDPEQYEKETEEVQPLNPITISVKFKELNWGSSSDSDSEEEIVYQCHEEKIFSAAGLLFPQPPLITHVAASTSPSSQTFKIKQGLLRKPAVSSLLSPDYVFLNVDDSDGDTHPRLEYPYHGMSRSCLEHQKSLWAARYEDWHAWHAHQIEAELAASAYDGLHAEATDATKSPRWGTPKLERDIPICYKDVQGLDDLNQYASIYPRMGDISTLRDPYFTLVDKCFSALSLGIVQRALFLFDMEFRVSGLNKRKISHQDVSAKPSLSSTCSSVPSCFEDIPLHTPDFDSSGSNTSNVASFSHDPLHVGPCRPLNEKRLIPPFTSAESTGSSHPFTLVSGTPRSQTGAPNSWETSWSVRWQVLGELVRREDPERYEILADCLMSYLHSLSAADESTTETVYPDDDNEDDYGTVIYKTSFNQHPSGFREDKYFNAACSDEAC